MILFQESNKGKFIMKIFKDVLADDGRFRIPSEVKSIKIDVGLAGEAPNSALWLSNDKDRFVIGIEPLEYHWKMIQNFETSNTLRPYPNNMKIVQLEKGIIEMNKAKVCDIGERFCKIQCAIDDVKKLEKRKFYQMDRKNGASGSSSLLKPSEKHPHFVENEVEVDTVSLEMILDHIDWDRFPMIEHIKTDCEGHDFIVVKSIGDKYLERVLFVSSEMSTANKDHWFGSYNHDDYIKFMISRGFSVVFRNENDIVFRNNRIDKIIDLIELGMRCDLFGA